MSKESILTKVEAVEADLEKILAKLHLGGSAGTAVTADESAVTAGTTAVVDDVSAVKAAVTDIKTDVSSL